MNKKNRKGLGSKLANFLIGVMIAVVAFGTAILVYFANIPGLIASKFGNQPALPQPSQTPDPSNLYTYFPHPTIGSTRMYNYSYVYAQYDQNMNVTGQKTEIGSYSETVTIVNQEFVSNDITIMGVEVKEKDYLARCKNNFYWVVYDSRRLYVICSKDYVFSAAAEMAGNPEPNLTANSQYSDKLLSLGPEYFSPFEIGKYWESNRFDEPNALEASVKGKVTKTIPLGTYADCFQFRFFAINYVELRYLCPEVGLVAIEVFDHDDYYSAEMVSLK